MPVFNDLVVTERLPQLPAIRERMQVKRISPLGVFLIIWLLAGPAVAGFPRLMNFQGRLDDSTGSPVANGDHDVTFRLFNVPAAGIPLWEETQTVTTQSGIFAVLLGSLDSVPEFIFFLDSAYLEIQPAGSDPVLPRSRLTSVPYAWRAREAELLGGLSAPELDESAEIDADIQAHTTISDAHHEKTISAGDLVTGILSEGRLPQGAIDSSEIELESIGADRLANEPGVAFSFVSQKLLSASLAVLDSAVITVPMGGYVLFMANGWFYKLHTSGSPEMSAKVSLSISRTAHEDDHAATFTVLSAAPSGHTNENFMISRVLAVAPGQTKIFVLGNVVAGIGTPLVEKLHVTSLYFPTAYGDVDAAAAE